MHVVVAELLPVHVRGLSVEFERPRAARDRVPEVLACAHLGLGELVHASDRPRLANTGQAIGADTGLRKHIGKLDAQELDEKIGLRTTLEHAEASSDWIQR